MPQLLHISLDVFPYANLDQDFSETKRFLYGIGIHVKFARRLQVFKILSLLYMINGGVLVDIMVVDDTRAWLCWEISCKTGGSFLQITISLDSLTCTTHADS
ncbi:uncharacterized protein Bfra_008679 [Botrytis fragariae]|uniref:Uncharacterized protein n=1 Tax=Botrytis fragariae TaxID=1964551 RepID=A0A8H6AQD3_9HELO|nr:uncharacterized protein Bfra_008679 [Botrytis fragariae]KAF5871656.1 hypothetical protein Bfra_008679 [Botrytis fragariae]